MINEPLPTDMTRENTCCFTGHRKIPADREKEVVLALSRTVRILAVNGYRWFVCGGAIGFDTLAAEAVLKWREKAKIRLFLALPCLDQTEDWVKYPDFEENIRRYRDIKAQADFVYYTGELRTQTAMKTRNQYMVDVSSLCTAFYNGAPRSGSGQTCRMAQKAGLEVYNLYDEIMR
ncbi:MAG: DUF1273 family protein [Clostridia bacterium]|nr:DUF1273 family protein [Clostridia bacterium]